MPLKFTPLLADDVDRAVTGAEIEIASASRVGKGRVQIVYRPSASHAIAPEFAVLTNHAVRYIGADKLEAIQRYNVEARLLLGC